MSQGLYQDLPHLRLIQVDTIFLVSLNWTDHISSFYGSGALSSVWSKTSLGPHQQFEPNPTSGPKL